MTFVAGQKLRVSDLTGGVTGGGSVAVGGGVSRMSADVTVNNTTTFTDSGLSLDVVANAIYKVSGWLRYSGGNTPDIKFQFTTPSGTTGYWSLTGHARDAAPVLDTSAGTTYVVEDIGTSKTVAGDATGTLLLAALINGEMSTTTAGTVKLRVAQRTATASNTVLRTSSRLELVRIA